MSGFQDPRPPAAATLGSLAADPRAGLMLAGRLGLRGVQLSSGQPGTRPRDLDRSGRRDLLATARRHELEISGIDVWIPLEAMLDPSTADQSAGELLAAIDLAGDLGGVAVSLRLPATDEDEITTTLAAHAARLGVPLVDHAVPPRGRGATRTDRTITPTGLLVPGEIDPAEADSKVAASGSVIEGVGIGIDPPAWLVAGLDVLEGAAAGVQSIRLADLTPDGMRIPPGEPDGRIDPTTLIAVARTGGWEGLPIIDARRWNDPPAGIQATLARIG